MDEKKYPFVLIQNCNSDDNRAFWIELQGDSIEEVEQLLGSFVMRTLAAYHTYMKETGTEPHVHICPQMLTRKEIDKIEVLTLIDDPRTQRSTD